MLKEFKTFIMRGNVIDLALAVIIGGAFNAIVGSLINDVITPLILKPAMEALKVSKLEDFVWRGTLFGKFIASVINFLVTAFVIFIIVKIINKMKQPTKEDVAPAPPTPTVDQALLIEIRDLLKNKQL